VGGGGSSRKGKNKGILDFVQKKTSARSKTEGGENPYRCDSTGKCWSKPMQILKISGEARQLTSLVLGEGSKMPSEKSRNNKKGKGRRQIILFLLQV